MAIRSKLDEDFLTPEKFPEVLSPDDLPPSDLSLLSLINSGPVTTLCCPTIKRTKAKILTKQGMKISRVQHRMHISGRYDRNEGGRLAVVAHAAGQGHLVVVCGGRR